MSSALSTQADEVCFALKTQETRRCLVDNILKFTAGTPLAADPYERRLLDQFVRGELTIDQVLAHLES
ncbi:hypothetical protein IC235_01625 [Hymenobacter sp. BT664]|uniref:Uncharacterized protein n=1 Tax=Hymenobacter montanus TaxID=2771359 RepID=A0A927BAG2_9BACT|nr:hypothetical protein [Hymenobacter montanus]MBD2766589.1 hypothetical protein [Hymenobacter montanus]